MNRFFRKIRIDMIKKNKITKYLLYALGEIVLVVVGILIALQVNNWNETRKDKNAAAKLYENLKHDLQEDIRQLDFDIQQTKMRTSQVDSILEILASKDESKLPQFLGYQIGLIYDNYFTPSRSTFDEAVSSGKINLISVDSIRKKLFQYYALNSNDRNNDNSSFFVTNELIIPTITREIFATKQGLQLMSQKTFDLPSINLKELSTNPKYFEALIYAKSDGIQISEWSEYKTMAESLLRAIDNQTQ